MNFAWNIFCVFPFAMQNTFIINNTSDFIFFNLFFLPYLALYVHCLKMDFWKLFSTQRSHIICWLMSLISLLIYYLFCLPFIFKLSQRISIPFFYWLDNNEKIVLQNKHNWCHFLLVIAYLICQSSHQFQTQK